MTKPIPSRRRSNSSAGGSSAAGGTGERTNHGGDSGGSTAVSRGQRRSGREASNSTSRSKRRVRNLPLTRPKQRESSDSAQESSRSLSATSSDANDERKSSQGQKNSDETKASLGTSKGSTSPKPSSSARDNSSKFKNSDPQNDDGSDGKADSHSLADSASSSDKKQKRRDRNSSVNPKSLHLSKPQALIARDEDGNDVTVRLVLNSQIFVNQAHSVGNLSRKRSRQDNNTSSSSNKNSNHDAVSNGSSSIGQPSLSGQASFLGRDGNLFHCHVCHGFGDVVCCDGCPHVYHPKCIPEGDPSRQSLENDDEPWFCPACFKESKKKKQSNTVSGSTSPTPETRANNSHSNNSEHRRTVKRRCCECHQSGGPNALQPCDGCGTYLHFPSCRGSSPSSGQSSSPNPQTVLCSTCRSERALMQEENDIMREKTKRKSDRQHQRQKQRQQRHKSDDDDESRADDTEADSKAGDEPNTNSKRRKTRSVVNEDMQANDDASTDDISQELSHATSNDGDDDDLQSENGEDHEKTAETPASESKKRRRPSLVTSSSPASTPKTEKKEKSKKKKKKKKQQQQQTATDGENRDNDNADPGGTPDDEQHLYQPLTSSPGMAKATPAFYFFLGENRFKIERVLARKHKYFNRLPKGVERNELVAREGALWWVKLRPIDTRRYMNLSMRDFEQRIIEWKEEKNIRDMLMETDLEDSRFGDSETKDLSPDDEMLTYLNHERLYLGTTVGSKPFKPDAGVSHNRVLLELLQDMRFHPVPMFSCNRTDAEYGQMDFSRITIPYFDVHGPVSTSVGDECLGCTRGWTHFCNVLSRRVPAVEHRARLQPPLSSLMATRVGLGLRPRAMPVAKQEETEEEGKKVEPFMVRDVPEAAAARNLPIVPWDSLTDPSSRADDIVQFIEEAVYMKVPEPPRPQHPGKSQSDSSKKSQLARGALPIRGRKRSFETLSLDANDGNRNSVVNKCGRCRTVIQTDTGCIQCRRAQLVINMSKRVSKEAPVSSSSKSSKSDSKRAKLLKVQTYMLGRVTMKEGSGEVQSKGDQAVSDGIIRQRWTPFAHLPPQTIPAPSPDSTVDHRPSEDSQESNVEEDSSNSRDQVPDDASHSNDGIEDSVDDGRANGSEGEDDRSRHSSKRLRSARIVAAVSTHSDLIDDADRQRLAEKHKEEAKELHKKTLSVACCGILLALMRRDPLLLFASPVTAEGYAAIVKSPIDFGKIRANVLSGKYSTLGSFVSDARLLCTNALAYNPPGSIYWKTAKELYDVLAVMQKRASNWMGAIKDAHAFSWRRASRSRKDSLSRDDDDASDEISMDDPFEQLRKKWPEAVEMLDNSDWLRKCITADFMRTKENETAYYGSLAVRRAAVAAEASLAPYPDTGGVFATVSRRSHVDDENLRQSVFDRVSEVIDPVELKDLPTWREESIVRVMRRTQSRRLEGRIGSINGCARCDGVRVDQELKMAMTAETVRWGRSRRKGNEVSRVSPSRIELSTGLASEKTRGRIEKHRKDGSLKNGTQTNYESAAAVAVSVKGSRIHGWGLFADQPFKKGDIVAEYLGEYVSLAVTEAREKIYQEQRIQDYQFRLDDTLVIDATMRGGHGRYINHNCNPNCLAKTIPGKPPNQHLKRVIIIAQRDIEPREELTYDYQFPLELDLDARIPCNCLSEQCRGFMNWDLPEKGSNNRVLRSQKRGANMRDRIRRLGRPLKSDK